MKFVTYSLGEGTNYRFGFKKNEYIVDIIRASIWANENKGDYSYLEIPQLLKALENWDINLRKLQKLNAILPVSIFNLTVEVINLLLILRTKYPCIPSTEPAII